MDGLPAHPAGFTVYVDMHAAWRDQVPRREAFERDHPEVTIRAGGVPLAPESDRAGWWQAAILDGDTVQYVTRYELGNLLDVLEERFVTP